MGKTEITVHDLSPHIDAYCFPGPVLGTGDE